MSAFIRSKNLGISIIIRFNGIEKHNMILHHHTITGMHSIVGSFTFVKKSVALGHRSFNGGGKKSLLYERNIQDKHVSLFAVCHKHIPFYRLDNDRVVPNLIRKHRQEC